MEMYIEATEIHRVVRSSQEQIEDSCLMTVRARSPYNTRHILTHLHFTTPLSGF